MYTIHTYIYVDTRVIYMDIHRLEILVQYLAKVLYRLKPGFRSDQREAIPRHKMFYLDANHWITIRLT